MSTLAYVAACVLVPAAWGVLSVWLFRRLERRRAETSRPAPPIDYSI